jgi:Do/DeqQ family serine protease
MPRTSNNLIIKILLVLVLAVTGNTASAVLPYAVGDKELPSLAPMLAEVMPAVVNISTEGTVRLRQNPLFQDPFFRRFFDIPDMPMERRTQSLGSGVIVDAERGLMLTNHHVIANADQITVTLHDGRKMSAEIVGSDPETDVAVIRVEADGLQAIKFSDSDKLRVGDFVVAIGNPFGLGQTVTSGIVSALERSGLQILGYEDFIQTDASINPGNSGGALVNLHGELVGINTAIFSQDGGNIGIGFAIPINLAMQVTEQIVDHGEVQRGFIGVQIQDLTPALAEAFGIEQTEGALIVEVMPDSPAAEAGLQAGDVVTMANNYRVANSAALRNRIGLLRVGETVKLEIMRNGDRHTINVTTSLQQERTAAAPTTQNILLQGISLAEIDSDHPHHGRVEGVLVINVERGSRAWRSGLREGDIVTSVNRQPITNMQEFLQLVDRQTDQLLLRIVRNESAAFIVIR